MKPQIRRFQIAPGKHLVLPMALYAAPGAKPHRMRDGSIIDLDFSKQSVRVHGRFIANRLKVGDLVEIDASKPMPEQPAPAPPAAAPAKAFEVNPPAAPAQGGKS